MPESAKTLWFISNVSPALGPGGQIVVERHLRRLVAQGWCVCVASHVAARTDAPWQQTQIPVRRMWWPPFRPTTPWLARLRGWAWLRELRAFPAPDVIATVCWGPLSWLAADAATRSRRPLVTIVHDHWSEIGSNSAARIGEHVVRHSEVVFAVSEEMRLALDRDFGPGKSTVLVPLPAARHRPFVEWQPRFAQPIVAHVGSLHPYHADYLRRVAAAIAPHGGHLLLLCPSNNAVARELRACVPNLVHQDTFPRNEQAIDFVAEHASALTVMYPADDSRGVPPLGFPSRLVEFSQLGLPILAAAPAGNPLANWAARHAWPSMLHPSDEPRLRELGAALAREETWRSFAAATRTVALSEFDADTIHSVFESHLTRLAATRRSSGVGRSSA